MQASEERIAHNEAVFRDVNERIAAGTWTAAPGHEVVIRCECASLDCNEPIGMTLAEYESIRADGRDFALVRGHEIPEIEVVVRHTDNYSVVRKLGTAGEVAAAVNPRDPD